MKIVGRGAGRCGEISQISDYTGARSPGQGSAVSRCEFMSEGSDMSALTSNTQGGNQFPFPTQTVRQSQHSQNVTSVEL